MSENDVNDLTTINGVQIRDGGILEIQVGFDGQTITYRDEDGELKDMGLLCYLHFIIHKFIDTMCDDEGNPRDPNGLTPGHVLCHLIQYLHDQHHKLLSHNMMATLANAVIDKGESPEDTGMSLYKFGENGIEEITHEELVETIAKIKDETEAESDGEEDDEDEIIIHGSPDEPQRHH